MTSGVVSRCETTSYVHSGTGSELLAVQIDAAVNSGGLSRELPSRGGGEAAAAAAASRSGRRVSVFFPFDEKNSRKQNPLPNGFNNNNNQKKTRQLRRSRLQRARGVRRRGVSVDGRFRRSRGGKQSCSFHLFFFLLSLALSFLTFKASLFIFDRSAGSSPSSSSTTFSRTSAATESFSASPASAWSGRRWSRRRCGPRSG